jgi:Zn-dependent protease/CBS domain-containing protein
VETNSIRLGTIAGVPIGASWSLLVVGVILGAGLAESRYPSTHAGYGDTVYWIAALVTVVAFFGSILAHEMGHALVARAKGLEVDGVTLWFLGGVTRMRGEVDGPASDAGVAAIGPLTSGVLGGAFLLSAEVASGVGIDPLAVAVLQWLALINLGLAVFNALPAAPLDGGGVLAAAIWWRTGDRVRGRRGAVLAGEVLGAGLLAFGVWSVVIDGPDTGIWLLLVGWFVFQTARSEATDLERAAQTIDPEAISVADLAPPDPPVVDETATVDDLIAMLGAIGQHSAVAVRDEAGVLSSAVLVEDLRSVPPGERAATSARSIALDIATQATAWSSELWRDVAPRLKGSTGVRVIAVYDPQMHLLALVTRVDVARFAHRHGLLSSTIGTGDGG